MMTTALTDAEGSKPPLTRYDLGSALWHQMTSEGKPLIPFIRALLDLAIEAPPATESQRTSVEVEQPSLEECEFAISWADAVLQREALDPEFRRIEAISKYMSAVALAKKELLSEMQLLAPQATNPRHCDDLELQIANIDSARASLMAALQPLRDITFEGLRQKVLQKQKRDRQNETQYQREMREFRATSEGKAKLAALAQREETERRQMLQIRDAIAHLERRHRR